MEQTQLDNTGVNNDANSQGKLSEAGETSYLKPSSVAVLWEPHPVTVDADTGCGYGMGWVVCPGGRPCRGALPSPTIFSHTGGAIGGSSALVIQPRQRAPQKNGKQDGSIQGVVVALICNMESVRLEGTAREIASVFEEVVGSSADE